MSPLPAHENYREFGPLPRSVIAKYVPITADLTVVNADYSDPQFPIPVQFSNVTSGPSAELYGKRN